MQTLSQFFSKLSASVLFVLFLGPMVLLEATPLVGPLAATIGSFVGIYVGLPGTPV